MSRPDAQTYVVQSIRSMKPTDALAAIQLRPVGSRSGFDSIRLPPGHGLNVGDWVSLTVRVVPAEAEQPEKRLA